jgi:hypothetical protein
MAKKKVAVKKVKPTKRPAAKTSKPTKPAKPAAKSAAKSKPVAKGKVAAQAKSAPVAARSAAAKASVSGSLGRPLVTQEEKLYMLFHEDYEARSVFEFLRVETVGDLIQLSAEEIVRVLTAPVRRTVNRIRQRLAEKNRSLLGDEEFTRQHQAKLL